MTIDEKNIVWLDLFEFLTYNKKIKLLETIKKGEDIRKTFLSNLHISSILNKDEISKMSLCLDEEYLNIKLKSYERDNITLITFYNPNYPYLLKEIDSPPMCLYCKGNIDLLNTFCIGVVGTRKPSEYGVIVTKQYVKELVKADVTIVSGLASGVDTIAHNTVMEESGKTIAVLAGGFNHIYPLTNTNLAKKLTENNLLISENNPDTPALAYLFPVRNRIIAGLSKGILVTEAGEKSGSLYTYNYAVNYNREVFAVPGRINSPMSKGTNQIIKELSGAITLSPDDIIETFGLNSKKNQEKSSFQLDIKTQSVLDYIQTEKKTFQELVDLTKIPSSELNVILMSLEMNGLVVKLANNSYIASLGE